MSFWTLSLASTAHTCSSVPIGAQTGLKPSMFVSKCQEPEPSSTSLEFLVGFPRRTRGEIFHPVSSMPGCGHLVEPGDAFVESVFGSSEQLLYLGIMLRLAYPPSLRECVCVWGGCFWKRECRKTVTRNIQNYLPGTEMGTAG